MGKLAFIIIIFEFIIIIIKVIFIFFHFTHINIIAEFCLDFNLLEVNFNLKLVLEDKVCN